MRLAILVVLLLFFSSIAIAQSFEGLNLTDMNMVLSHLRFVFLVVQGAMLSVLGILMTVTWKWIRSLEQYTRHEIRNMHNSVAGVSNLMLSGERRVNDTAKVLHQKILELEMDKARRVMRCQTPQPQEKG